MKPINPFTTGELCIPSEGSITAKIAIVGEAPGVNEVRHNRPFVGRAGEVLDRQLARVGIPRASCYITNVVKERPPGNKIFPFIDISKKNAVITEAGQYYIDELKKELEQCEANVIVACGNVPLYVLTGLREITKRRGSLYESTLLPGRKVLACLHPASVLYGKGAERGITDPIRESYIMYDLQRAREQSEFPELAPPTPNLIINPSFDHTLAYIKRCRESKLFAFDIEVFREEVVSISLAASVYHAISIPFFDSRADYFPPHQEIVVWRALGALLEDDSIEKIGHNSIFDTAFLYNRYGLRINNLHDTMIAQRILFPEYPATLAFVTSIYTDYPYYKDTGKKHMKIQGSWDAFWEYNALDSIAPIVALPKMLVLLERQGNMETYKRHCGCINPLMIMSERGMRLDHEGLAAASKDAEEHIREMEIELAELAGPGLNHRSPKQLLNYFYGVLGHKPYMLRSKPTTNIDALKRLARKGVREAELIRDIRHYDKRNNTYYTVTLDADKRLRGSMDPVGTENGRFSSSKTIFGTGMNVHNQPPEMKELIIPDEDHVMYILDLRQAENRDVAWIAPEPTMKRAFLEGRDVHRLTAALLFHIPFDEVSDKKGSSPLGNGQLSQRDWGKRTNHALNYGLGVSKFSLMYDLSEGEGRQLHSAYHRAYPNIQGSYHQWIVQQLRKDRTLTNSYGRKRRFFGNWGEELFREAYAFIPQSTVADKIIIDGIQELENNEYLREHVWLLNTIHDSLVIQIPLELPWTTHAELLDMLVVSLESPLVWQGEQFTIPAEVKMGNNSLGQEVIYMDKEISRNDVARSLKTAYNTISGVKI